MQIKKYLAPTLKEATVQMKEELGSEAIILGSRLVEENTKIGRKKMFEITVGFDEAVQDEIEETGEEYDSNKGNSFSDEIAALSEKVYPAAGNYKKQTPDESINYKYQNLSSLMSRTAKEPEFPEGKNNIFTSEKNNNSRNNLSVEEELKDISDLLSHREISKPIISIILNQLEQYRKFLHSSNIDNYVLSGIASMIPTHNFELQKNNNPKVVAVVGPTGVGKTTCIAKLAVIAKILHNLNVGLISIDTYRLGAIDQLRIFSEISNIDMLIAYEPEEMQGLLSSFKDKDIIFIDTAGRSQRNSEHLTKTKSYLEPIKVDETFLALSSTNSTKNLFDTAEKFKLFNYNSFIFTKIDEGVTFGNLLNTLTTFNVPVTFLSNGQVIPDDIISADSGFLANLIYTGKLRK
jgi:flagellar biosynthesis protein FlhF